MARPIMTWPQRWCADVETEFRLRSNSFLSNGFTPGAPDIYGPHAQVWTASIPIAVQKDRRQWMAIEAFFSRAGGIAGRIRMFDPKRPRPGRDIKRAEQRAADLGQPWSDGQMWSDGTGWSESDLPPYCVVDEAAAAGADSIVLSGLPVSEAPCLWAGDLMEVRPNGQPADFGHLYEAAFDAPTDAAGKTRVYINPGLRAGVGAGDQVVLRFPTSVFRLVDDDQGRLGHMLGGAARSGFALLELVPR